MEIFYTDTAKQQLKALEHDLRERILEKLQFYASQPDPLDFAERLSGLRAFRFRVGDYRVVVQHNQSLLYVLSIRRRDEAYR
jgi:mRNA interferase RelE/StbE